MQGSLLDKDRFKVYDSNLKQPQPGVPCPPKTHTIQPKTNHTTPYNTSDKWDNKRTNLFNTDGEWITKHTNLLYTDG